MILKKLTNLIKIYSFLSIWGWFIIFSIATNCCHAQATWQWAAVGGGSNYFDPNLLMKEGVHSIVTDSQKNVYFITQVGTLDLLVNGQPRTHYDVPNGAFAIDGLLVSYACDGSFRWSKIVSGWKEQGISDLAIDAQDNIYITGSFGNCDPPDIFDPTWYFPPRIENDFILYNTQTNRDCATTFIAKYNRNGVMQWIQRPQQASVNRLVEGLWPGSLSVDAAGNSYSFVLASPGSYANGAYINNLTYSNQSRTAAFMIFKYNAAGVFTDAIPFDIQCSYISDIKLFRNPYNGNYYITGNRDPRDTVTIAGQNVTHSTFLACFNSQGVFQYKKENTSTEVFSTRTQSLAFDNQNNIYVALDTGSTNSGCDTFLGFTTVQGYRPNTVLKVDATAANLTWSTQSNSRYFAYPWGRLTVNDTEVGYSNISGGRDDGSGAIPFSWGSLPQTITNNQSVLFARLDKNTGNCLSYNFLLNDLTGPTTDNSQALAVDASGDYYTGGGYESSIFMGNGRQYSNPDAGENDFFIAKYATQACSPLATTDFTEDNKNLIISPNPTQDVINVLYNFDDPFSDKNIQIIDLQGRLLFNMRINDLKGNAQIDCSQYATGNYIILTKENGKLIKSNKLIIR
jgi:Secretion system C-terminal sorting domain